MQLFAGATINNRSLYGAYAVEGISRARAPHGQGAGILTPLRPGEEKPALRAEPTTPLSLRLNPAAKVLNVVPNNNTAEAAYSAAASVDWSAGAPRGRSACKPPPCWSVTEGRRGNRVGTRAYKHPRAGADVVRSGAPPPSPGAARTSLYCS